MKIYAPSYKRHKGVKTHKIIKDIIYCVHEFEAEDYKKLGYNIEVMPDSIKGNIARVRNYILDNYIDEKGLIVDDDLEAIKRWNVKEGKPKQEKIENIIRYETSSSETSKSSHSEIIHQNQFFRQQARSQVFRLSA